ncbi:dipeptide ABC transporter ATP-binding protein [Georgenia daeguensis]|uniref:Dipeptide ABC transporter ATP-binding protein n=1 Tax=Georgenia daeguensis TaxID=908355 RepID=A0ABP8EV97_9MICO
MSPIATSTAPLRPGATSGEPLLEVVDLHKHYPVKEGRVRKRQTATLRAVDGVTFTVRQGESFGLVGESGCGKSTLAQTITRLVEPTSGQVRYRGQDILTMTPAELRAFRRKVQLVFQDPFESLNPRKTVRQILSEPWEIHPDVVARTDRRRRAGELLEMVGLRPDHLDRYPGQFSGGQRQRIGIARALALGPELIVCDEPVSALDVSVQAQVINLLQELQAELGLSYVFIAHDLGVVRHIADTVGVMYLGRMVEYGPEADIFERTQHPYTQALLRSVPRARFGAGAGRPARQLLTGDVPSPIDPPSGCRFRTRCTFATDLCAESEPSLPDHRTADQGAACHFPGIAADALASAAQAVPAETDVVARPS